MPAKTIDINLIGRDTFHQTPQGRIVTWALSYGRYIMIGTEIVVLLAFISRFSLDRRLTDLREEIDQKQIIIETNLPFEQEIRSVQDQIIKIKSLLENQVKPVETLETLVKLLPTDVYLTSLEISNTTISARVVALTTLGFTQFLNNLQATKSIARVDLTDVRKNAGSGIEFRFTAELSK